MLPIDCAKALRDSYNRATESQKTEGGRWYRIVRTYAIDLAMKYERPLFQVVGIIAVLSPRNRFQRNLQDAESVLRDGALATVATFNANKRKALAILETESPEETLALLGGNKVRSFYSNFLELRDDEVTIDVWMLRLMGIEGSLTAARYRDAADVVRYVAREVGVQPKELQAITWVELRGEAY